MKPARLLASLLLATVLAVTMAIPACSFDRTADSAARAATAGAFDQLKTEIAKLKEEAGAALKEEATIAGLKLQIEVLEKSLERLDKLEAWMVRMEAEIKAKPPSERTAQDWLLLGLFSIFGPGVVTATRDKLTAKKRDAQNKLAAMAKAAGMVPS